MLSTDWQLAIVPFNERSIMSIATEVVGEAVGAVVPSPIKTVKIVILSVIAVVFLGMAATSWYLFHELKAANAETGQLKEKNATLKQDLDLIKVGQGAMAVGQILSDQQKKELDDKARQSRTLLKATEQQIDRSANTPEEKARLKSVARMTSVMIMYCQIQPTNTACQPAATAAVPDKGEVK